MMDGATSIHLATVFGVAPIFVIIVAALFWWTFKRLAAHEAECATFQAAVTGQLTELNGKLERLIGVVEGRLPPLE